MRADEERGQGGSPQVSAVKRAAVLFAGAFVSPIATRAPSVLKVSLNGRVDLEGGGGKGGLA